MRPIGADAEVAFDVRVVAATNRDLEAMVAEPRVPRGPLLPHQRHPPRAAAAARARGRHPAARPALPRSLRAHVRQAGARTLAGGRRAPLALRLAGQRARAAQLRSSARSRWRPADDLAVEDLPERIRDYRGRRRDVGRDRSSTAARGDRAPSHPARPRGPRRQQARRLRPLGIDRKTLYRKLLRYGVERES